VSARPAEVSARPAEASARPVAQRQAFAPREQELAASDVAFAEYLGPLAPPPRSAPSQRPVPPQQSAPSQRMVARMVQEPNQTIVVPPSRSGELPAQAVVRGARSFVYEPEPVPVDENKLIVLGYSTTLRGSIGIKIADVRNPSQEIGRVMIVKRGDGDTDVTVNFVAGQSGRYSQQDQDNVKKHALIFNIVCQQVISTKRVKADISKKDSRGRFIGKRDHWMWIFFPTDRNGKADIDYLVKLYDNEEMVGLLLEILTKVRVGQENALESWTSIINQLALIGEQYGSKGWTPAVMSQDLGRLEISLKMLFKYPRILKKYPFLEAALLRLCESGDNEAKRMGSIYERDYERVQSGLDAPITILERYLIEAIHEAIKSHIEDVGLSRGAASPAEPSASSRDQGRKRPQLKSRSAFESDTDESSDVASDAAVENQYAAVENPYAAVENPSAPLLIRRQQQLGLSAARPQSSVENPNAPLLPRRENIQSAVRPNLSSNARPSVSAEELQSRQQPFARPMAPQYDADEPFDEQRQQQSARPMAPQYDADEPFDKPLLPRQQQSARPIASLFDADEPLSRQRSSSSKQVLPKRQAEPSASSKRVLHRRQAEPSASSKRVIPRRQAGPSSKPENWECEICMYENNGDLQQCRFCGVEKN